MQTLIRIHEHDRRVVIGTRDFFMRPGKIGALRVVSALDVDDIERNSGEFDRRRHPARDHSQTHFCTNVSNEIDARLISSTRIRAKEFLGPDETR